MKDKLFVFFCFQYDIACMYNIYKDTITHTPPRRNSQSFCILYFVGMQFDDMDLYGCDIKHIYSSHASSSTYVLYDAYICSCT